MGPGVDGLVVFHHLDEDLHIGIGEVGLQHRGNLLRRVGKHPLLPPADGSGKTCKELRILRHLALGGKIGGKRHLTAGLTNRSQDIALALELHCRGGGLEDGDIVAGAGGKSRSHQREVDTVVKDDIFTGGQTVRAHHILKGHIGNAALASGQQRTACKILPLEVLIRGPAD